MSEYQYYEFLAVDRPLTSDEMEVLRRCSSRAQITPVSFSNHYDWGSFAGDTRLMMTHYFDLHVYVANWRTALFMVKIPLDAVTREAAESLAVPGILDFEARGKNWLIAWSLDESEDYDRFGMEAGRGWMARLAPVREELLRGDYRSLYIGWLAAVSYGVIEDDGLEPIRPAGLGQPTAAQTALARFIEVDVDLLESAGFGDTGQAEAGMTEAEIENWIGTLPVGEMKGIIGEILRGKEQGAARSLKNRFASWREELRRGQPGLRRRTAGEIRGSREQARQMRVEREAREEERKRQKLRKERVIYLHALYEDAPRVWKSIDHIVSRGSGVAYREAYQILADLSEGYGLESQKEQFVDKLRVFMSLNQQRKALIKRIVDGEIWKL